MFRKAKEQHPRNEELESQKRAQEIERWHQKERIKEQRNEAAVRKIAGPLMDEAHGILSEMMAEFGWGWNKKERNGYYLVNSSLKNMVSYEIIHEYSTYSSAYSLTRGWRDTKAYIKFHVDKHAAEISGKVNVFYMGQDYNERSHMMHTRDCEPSSEAIREAFVELITKWG